jgi:ribonuclease HI
MVIATLSQKVQACHSAEMIEALAAKRAIHFAIEVGLTDVEFKGDAETIIRDLNRAEAIHNAYGLVLDDVKTMLQEIRCHTLSHTRRSGNNVAHALARRALNCNNYLVWLEEVPPDITHVVLTELYALE